MTKVKEIIILSLKWFAVAVLLGIVLWGVSLYIRRNTLLKQGIEQYVAQHHSSISLELGSAKFSGWEGIILHSVKVKNNSSANQPIIEFQEAMIECPLSWRGLFRRDFKILRVNVNGAVLHLPSATVPPGLGVELEKKLAGILPCPLEVTQLQLVFPLERGGRKELQTTDPFELSLYPPRTNPDQTVSESQWSVRGSFTGSQGRVTPYHGDLSKKFDQWFAKLLKERSQPAAV